MNIAKPHEIGPTKALIADLLGVPVADIGSAECAQALAHPDEDLGANPTATRLKITYLKMLFEKVGE